MPTIEERREHERQKYLRLEREHPNYGSTNHGVASIPILARWLDGKLNNGEEDDVSIADFGCGRNLFLKQLWMKFHIEDVGIDWAFPEADVRRPMHDTGMPSEYFYVITCFDALEHLIPEDVPLVLDEMRRVAVPQGRWIFSIHTGPSTTTVDGEGLHATVRPMEWWRKQIERVATIEAEEGRYIYGRFR